ncbi:MAG TPA: BON domain-containing protein [Terriglobales bacterium]|nr:BON domain-containing protein [Terriglobales bacterium]
MWSKIQAFALASLLVFGFGSALAQKSNQGGYAPDGNAKRISPYAGQQSDQDRIAREVRHQLVMLPYYSVFDDLAYKVDGSTVTLYGATLEPGLKRDAEAAVKHIEGVDKVVNNIQELPPSPMDDQIRRAEFRAIYATPQLQKYGWYAVQGIHIIVDNGHVTLTGVVDNQADKDIANLKANSVPNVFSVTNDLQVANNQRASK